VTGLSPRDRRPGRTASPHCIAARHGNHRVLQGLHLRAFEEDEMLNDDLNRNELNRDSLGRTDRTRMGGGMIALIVGIAVFALLFMWAPWNGPRVANAPGSTVGSSTTRPSAPMAPNTAPAPVAPSTTR
jgi:hypothetical protein